MNVELALKIDVIAEAPAKIIRKIEVEVLNEKYEEKIVPLAVKAATAKKRKIEIVIEHTIEKGVHE